MTKVYSDLFYLALPLRHRKYNKTTSCLQIAAMCKILCLLTQKINTHNSSIKTFLPKIILHSTVGGNVYHKNIIWVWIRAAQNERKLQCWVTVLKFVIILLQYFTNLTHSITRRIKQKSQATWFFCVNCVQTRRPFLNQEKNKATTELNVESQRLCKWLLAGKKKRGPLVESVE